MKKYPVLTLIVGLIALIVFQQKAVMPFVWRVIQSDLFLVDSKDIGDMAPISTPLTGLAFTHCNTYIKSKLGPDVSISFPEKPLNAWSIGNYHYVINAEINVTTAANTSTKKYVCRINYKNGDDEEGSFDFANWSVEGLAGLEAL
jgi:hypothetical protein